MRHALAVILIGLLAFAAGPAGAVKPDEMLDDPVLEARARDISAGLRCLVCQNQSIDDSNAELARDLRLLVRERLVSGDSDDEVRAYVVARYGDFILLKPPFKPETYFLWFGPGIILVLGAIGVAVYMRRRPAPSAGDNKPLDPAEEARLARLLDDEDGLAPKS
jgi:cytochrome c-type biogenesis protein CcmH